MKKTAEHPSRSLGFLSRYHDGELSAAEAREFDVHAGTCSECRFAREEYEAVLAMYRASETETADAALAARITRRIDTEIRHRSPVRYVTLQIDLLWASIIAVCLVGVLTLYSGLDRRPRRSAAPVSIVAEAERPPAVVPAAEPAPAPTPRPAAPHRRAVPPPVLSAPEFSPVPGAASGDSAERSGSSAAAPAPASSAGGAAREAPAQAAPEAASAPVLRKAEAAPEAALPIGGPVSSPVLVHRVDPILPESMRDRFVTGSPIVLEAVISENGDVANVKVLRSHPPFDAAAVAAVRQWKYRPALRGGRPVPVYLVVTVTLSEER